MKSVASALEKRRQLSQGASQVFFKETVLPRRARDLTAEEKYFQKFGTRRRIYRRIQLDETDRALPYPVAKAGLRTLAHFGIGIGVYFLQLVVMGLTCLVGGCIMLVGIR
ncbi:hypothetical protein B484DRAFT_399219 [Ochromonadaceae sp. CCMP2298]|nr:hypothetical protein B484DRAFT_399219 [Ochromonadaceae sp. CCMP2298]